MAKTNMKIVYDEEVDILLLSKGSKVKASIDVGDFVIDIDHKGFVSAIEILNATETLKISEEQLKSIKDAVMLVTYKPNHVYINIVMQVAGKEKDITIPLDVDLGNKPFNQSVKFAVA